jgi:DNA uptake protein ComE-like DNA-binding protein
MKIKSAIHIKNNKGRRGIALIIVMWICLALVTVTLNFGDAMILEYRAAENSTAGLSSSQSIDGAMRYVKFILANMENPGYVPDPETYESEKVIIGDTVSWFIGRNYNEDPGNTPEFGIYPEASKLNINTASVEMLEAVPGMTAELAAAIVDWRDSDLEITPNGAESEYYLMLERPYNCKDGNFETVEELKLVAGCDMDILYGEDYNQNGILDPNENDGSENFPEDNADGKLDSGIMEYLTVYTRETNKKADGTDRVNIKEDPQELGELFRKEFGEDRTAKILESVGMGMRNINSVLEFSIKSGMAPDEFSKVEDSLTVSNEEYLEGLVNINTASPEVLSCIPGIGEAESGELVSVRTDKSLEDIESILWITEVLDEEQIIQAGPYITTKSSQFSVDIAATGQNGSGYMRSLFIFDVSGDEILVLRRKDLGRYGWALGADIREELDTITEE